MSCGISVKVSFYYYPIIILVGFAAGFFNTLAGGGSIITLPLLIFLGLPADVANGTNRVAVFAQNSFAIAGFAKLGVSRLRLGLLLSVFAVLGAYLGATLSLKIDEALFHKLLAVTMVLVTALLFKRPEQAAASCHDLDKSLSWQRLVLLMVVFFFVGFYIGFIQVGVGLIIIMLLSLLTSFDLVTINAIKVVVNCLTILVSMVTFWYHGKVNWHVGIPMAIGMGLGGWFGSHAAVKKGEKLIRICMAIAAVAMAVKLFFK